MHEFRWHLVQQVSPIPGATKNHSYNLMKSVSSIMFKLNKFDQISINVKRRQIGNLKNSKKILFILCYILTCNNFKNLFLLKGYNFFYTLNSVDFNFIKFYFTLKVFGFILL